MHFESQIHAQNSDETKTGTAPCNLLAGKPGILYGVAFNGAASGFGCFFFLVSVYTGRWIGTQAAAASWVDMFRMFFLGLLTLSLGALAIFASYVEADLELLHYLESWINIFCFGSISVLAGFFTYRIRQKIAAKALDKRAVGGQKM